MFTIITYRFNYTKQNETKQNKTKQNKTKQNNNHLEISIKIKYIIILGFVGQ